MITKGSRYIVENRDDVWVTVDAISRKVVDRFGRTELQRQRALRVPLRRNLAARFGPRKVRFAAAVR
jgi:hypothetical protein